MTYLSYATKQDRDNAGESDRLSKQEGWPRHEKEDGGFHDRELPYLGELKNVRKEGKS